MRMVNGDAPTVRISAFWPARCINSSTGERSCGVLPTSLATVANSSGSAGGGETCKGEFWGAGCCTCDNEAVLRQRKNRKANPGRYTRITREVSIQSLLLL